MLSTNDLFQLKLRAVDGEAGSVCDLVFHDSAWAIHALIAETGGWLSSRRVSLDPDVVLEPDLAAGVLPVVLTKDEVRDAPSGDALLAAASPAEEDVLAWNQSNTLAALPENVLLAGATVPVQPLATEPQPPSLHLRSLEDVLGYEVLAGDDVAGRLAGFIVDPIAWDLPMALVQLETGGPSVLLPTRLIAGIGWPDRVVQTYLNPETLRRAPAYDPRVLDERVYLPAVADYYSTRV